MSATDEEIASFLAMPSPRAVQVSDDEVADFLGTPSNRPPPPAPGRIEALLRGAKQGATLGFGDEITGFVESLFSDKTYQQARNEARAADAAAQQAHGGYYLGGNIAGGIAGSLVPGLGVARGATALAAAGKGLATGAIAGLGGSEADLTTEEGRGQAVGDVAKGALMGAAGGFVGQKISRALAGAPARATESAVKELRKGAQNSTLLRAFGELGKDGKPVRYEAIKTTLNQAPGVRRALKAGDIDKAFEVATGKVDDLGGQLGEVYERAAKAGGSVDGRPIAARLDAMVDNFDETASPEARALLQRVAKQFRGESPAPPVRMPGAAPETPRIPIQDLHKRLQAWQDIAFKSTKSLADLTPRQEAARDISAVLKDALQDEIERVATKNPDLGISREALQSLNKQYSNWISIHRILAERARRAFSGAREGKSLFSQGIIPTAKRGAQAIGDFLDYNALAPAVRQLGPARVERAVRQLSPSTASGAARLRSDDVRDFIRNALTPEEEPEGMAY